MRQESWAKNKTKKEFEELLLEVRRVTRVTTWGRRLSFRATVLVWDKKWKIWIWLSKWWDVTSAVKKASNEAYKNMFQVPITRSDTVPYPISLNYKACFIKLLPAFENWFNEFIVTLKIVFSFKNTQKFQKNSLTKS